MADDLRRWEEAEAVRGQEEVAPAVHGPSRARARTWKDRRDAWADNPRVITVLRIGSALMLLALWELGAVTGVLSNSFSSPTAVVNELHYQFSTGSIWRHIEATVTAAAWGFVLGSIAGMSLGWLAAVDRLFGKIVEPYMLQLNSMPRIALAPIFFLFFGLSIWSKVAVSFLLVFVIIFFGVYSGLKEVDPRLIERVRILGGSGRDVFLQVHLPSVAAWIFSSLRLTIAFAFTGAIVGEFVAASRGLGYLLAWAANTFQSARMYAVIVIIMVMIAIIFTIVQKVEERAMVWKESSRGSLL